MNWKNCCSFLIALISTWSVASTCVAGSERFIMTMTDERMAHDNLIFARLFGPDGAVLESDVLKKLVIREGDCTSGHALALTKEYKLGYSPKNRLVGVYLFPQAWKDSSICFEVEGLGKAERRFNPAKDEPRVFELTLSR